MDNEGFRRFLQERKTPDDQIEASISLVEKFVDFLREADHPEHLNSSTREDIQAFSTSLIKEKQNTLENYYALARYGRYIKNNEIYIWVVELLDGAEAFDNLYNKVGATFGERVRNEIFEGIELPLLGTPNAPKPRLTEIVMKRLESMDPKKCKEILASGLRDLADEYYLEDKKKYLECKDIDEYLERKGMEFISQLEQMKNEGRLYYTQQINDEVIEFVRSHPEIRQGVREGNILYEIKIPYNTKAYLAATDEVMKRYHYCHCPWVKESLKSGKAHISPTFCNCSAAFVKKPWEVIFGQPLQAEIVESVLQGDLWCKIAIHLPEKD
jgi:hypothetical protein